MCIYAWRWRLCKIHKIQHILFDCPAFNKCRKLFYELNSLKELLSVIFLDLFLEFLSCVNQILCNITFFVCWFLLYLLYLYFSIVFAMKTALNTDMALNKEYTTIWNKH